MADVLTIPHAVGGHPQSHQKMKYHSLIVSYSWHHVCGSACRPDWSSRSPPSQLAKVSNSFDVSTFCSCSELEWNQMLRFLLWTGNVTYFLFITLAGRLWDKNQTGLVLTSVTSGWLYQRTLVTCSRWMELPNTTSEVTHLILAPAWFSLCYQWVCCMLCWPCQWKAPFYTVLVKLMQWVSAFLMIIWTSVTHAKVTEQG